MSTMVIERALLEQALEALEEINKLSIGENAICLPAEIDGAMDALRAALAQQAEPTRSQQMADAGFTRRPSLWSLQAREALELIAAPQRPDGTWNRDREACRQLAAEALGRYDDE